MPNEIKELLKFSSGFEFYGLEEITFDGVGQFGLRKVVFNIWQDSFRDYSANPLKVSEKGVSEQIVNLYSIAPP